MRRYSYLKHRIGERRVCKGEFKLNRFTNFERVQVGLLRRLSAFHLQTQTMPLPHETRGKPKTIQYEYTGKETNGNEMAGTRLDRKELLTGGGGNGRVDELEEAVAREQLAKSEVAREVVAVRPGGVHSLAVVVRAEVRHRAARAALCAHVEKPFVARVDAIARQNRRAVVLRNASLSNKNY